MVLLELAYRYQWGDFYGVEWSHFNDGKLAEEAKGEILIMGDSFSTSDNGYVELLRKRFPEINIGNSAVPGTGVIEASYMASRRFADRKPDTFIYQIYLGNDLFDLEKPVNWGELGIMRNLYWWSANRMRSLTWVNYKMGQFQAPPSGDAKEYEEGFSPELYNKREKNYFASDRDWLRGQAEVGSEEWSSQRERYFDYLHDLLEYPKEHKAQTLFLVIPHCSQLGRPYQDRMEKIGMKPGKEIPSSIKEHAWLRELQEIALNDPTIDLLFPIDLLRETESRGEAVFYQNDPHLNAKGQEVIATALEGWLNKDCY